MKTLSAAYFDGRTSRRWPATLGLEGGEVVLRGAFGEQRFPLAQLRVGESVGAERALEFPDGARCLVADQPALRAWLAAAGSGDSGVARMQRRWPWAFGALLAVVLLLAVGYLYALPACARIIAPRIPESVVHQLSAQTLASLDQHLLLPSALPASRQEQLRRRLDALAAGRKLPAYQLHFRASGMGPNAFALPGGEVVVFDALVALAGSDEEVLGVIAHELGHVAGHHGLRQLMQSSAVSLAVGLYLGDISSMVTGLGSLVLASRYSRGFEEEADDYAAAIMRSAGYGTAPLIRMFERLAQAHAASARSIPSGHLLDSHPETLARIARLRAIP